MSHFVLPLALFAVQALCLSGFPSVCLSGPPVQLQAGVSEVSMIVEQDLSAQCQASIYFDDLSLPLFFSFPSVQCAGTELISFVLPQGLTSGDASITWQCTGMAPSCSRAVIFGGIVDQPIRPDWAGQAACITESLQTSTSILTETESSTIVVKTLMSLITVTMTSSLAGPINPWTAPSASWESLNSTNTGCIDMSIGTASSDIAVETGRKSSRSFSNHSITIGSSGSAINPATPVGTATISRLPVTAAAHRAIPIITYGFIVLCPLLFDVAALLQN